MYLRKVEERDICEIISLNNETGLGWWAFSDYVAWIAGKEVDFRLVEVGEPTRIGGFFLSQLFDFEMELLKLAVAPNLRRKGIGRLLLEASLEKGREAGCDRCFLEVRAGNVAAQKFYHHLGFRMIAVRKNYYQSPRDDAIVMEKLLTESESGSSRNQSRQRRSQSAPLGT